MSHLNGKIPPQALDLEKAVLGAILMESYCLPTVLNLIFEEVFYSDSHQKIFKAIIALYDQNKQIDILTVSNQLEKHGDLESVGNRYYVAQLTRELVSSANIEPHCMILVQKYLGREMIKIASKSLNDAYDDCIDILDLYDSVDNQVINTQEKILKSTIKDMPYYSAKVYDEYETVKSTGVLGLQTGIAPIDRIFCGLVAPDLIIIAARPGQGKTAFALSVTYNLSVLNNIPGSWFSLEMDGKQLTRRLIAIDSGISHENIRQGKVSDSESKQFFNSLDRVGNAPIFIEDKGSVNIRTIRTRAHILKRRNKIQYIIVDYLQLMNGIDVKNKNRDSIIGEISRGLKELAKELDLPIIALSQLSREVEKRSDKMPQLSDLRESGNIEQDADEVIFLMRPEYYEFTEPAEIAGTEYDVSGLCIGKGAKNRHGGCHNFAMYFNAPVMQFSTHFKDNAPKKEIPLTDYAF